MNPSAPAKIIGIDHGHGCYCTPDEASRRIIVTFCLERAAEVSDSTYELGELTERLLASADVDEAMRITDDWIGT